MKVTESPRFRVPALLYSRPRSGPCGPRSMLPVYELARTFVCRSTQSSNNHVLSSSIASCASICWCHAALTAEVGGGTALWADGANGKCARIPFKQHPTGGTPLGCLQPRWISDENGSNLPTCFRLGSRAELPYETAHQPTISRLECSAVAESQHRSVADKRAQVGLSVVHRTFTYVSVGTDTPLRPGSDI